MNSNLAVSVVMPSLNHKQFIADSVRSVLTQDYVNLELIIVDGISRDGSQELITQLQSEFPGKLRWMSMIDSGPAEAINIALSLCEGEIIGWLNSDDLYFPEAIQRAVDHFIQHPNHQLVYGLARHIDLSGFQIGAYPTKPPSTPIDEFSNGNFICQPTVFMRKEALDLVGPLDESLKTAFDFELWMRFFKRFPGQIGLVRRLQASSRLHSACLTQMQRQTVALEGMKVLSRHLSYVPLHWFNTHLDEICDSYPLGPQKEPLFKQLESFIQASKPFLSQSDLQNLRDQLSSDYRLILSKPGLAVTVQPDGWVSRKAVVKYLWENKPATAVLLRCSAYWPVPGKMRLKVRTPGAELLTTSIEVPDEFVLRLEVPKINKSGAMIWSIETSQSFVPSNYEKGSKDIRRLSFKVLELTTEV